MVHVISRKKRNLPGPRGYLGLRNLLQVKRDRLGFVMSLTGTYGDFVRFTMGTRTLYLLNHPDAVKHVLKNNYGNYSVGIGLSEARQWLGNGSLTSENEHCRQQRRVIQPAFHAQKLRAISLGITDSTGSMFERWDKKVRHQGAIEIMSEMKQLTLDNLGKAFFGYSLNGKAEDLLMAFKVCSDQAMHEMTSVLRLSRHLPSLRRVKFRQAHRILDDIVNVLIRKQQERSNGSDNFLSLLESQLDLSDPHHQEQVRDEIMTLLLAGHETTACALTWTLYQIGNRPDVQTKMQEEITSILGGRVPEYEDVAKLKFTKMVLDESLRLYPPVWLIPRRAHNDDSVNGYPISAGSEVLICPYSLHRHPGYWDNPESFDPERFSTRRDDELFKYVYLPFGAGPRYCVGASFAILESLLILAMIIQRYRLRVVANQEIIPHASLTLYPKNGLMMELTTNKFTSGS